MPRISALARKDWTFIDLLAVSFILAVAVCLVVAALPRVRAADQQAGCSNNLKQVGLAFHSYHDNEKCLPSEGADNPNYIKKIPSTHGHTSFYCYLLPYLEESKQWKVLMGNKSQVGDLTKAQPVKLFLCPDRHKVTGATKLALRDFGYRRSEGEKHSVLDPELPVNFFSITCANGTGYTAFITHCWWDAKKYNDAARTNNTDGWANEGYDGKNRAIDQFDTDYNQPDSKALPNKAETGMGSPHAAGNPTLMADGSVLIIPYDPKWPAVKLFFDFRNQTSYKLP